LANALLGCDDDWDPSELHSSVQHEIPPRQYISDDVPFAPGRELIVDVPVDSRGYIDVYIDDTTGLTVDLPNSGNAERLEAAIPLAIEVAARPTDASEPIPREPMVAKDKLKAEGGLSETKVILGWHFNFRTLTVTLPEHKFIAWSTEIHKMIDSGKTTKKDLESTIGRMGHVGFIIPWVFHFLSRLRSLLARAQNRRVITIDDTCKKDLALMISILDKARKGIDMNLLAFRSPDRIYYSDSCPHGLGGYSDQGSAWRFQIPEDLLFRASNNLLEFLAAIITPWIDIINGRLNPGDCALSTHLYSTLPFPKPDASPFRDITATQRDQLLADIAAAAIARERAVTGGTHDGEARAWRRWTAYCESVGCRDLYMDSGRQEDRTPQRTKTMSLASFYRDNSEPSKTTIPNSNNKRPSPSSSSTN